MQETQVPGLAVSSRAAGKREQAREDLEQLPTKALPALPLPNSREPLS